MTSKRSAFTPALSLLLGCLAATLVGCGGQDTSAAAPAASSASAAASSPTPAGSDVNTSGDIPDTQAYVAYTIPSGTATLMVPEGWARADSGGAVAFTSHFNSIRVATMPAASAPTVASAQSTEADAITRQGRNVVIGAVSSVTRKAGTAILITYKADSAADPVTGRAARLDVQRYEFWRNGVEAVITLASPVGSDNVDPWRTITDSFQWR